jgi:hypothetical protein
VSDSGSMIPIDVKMMEKTQDIKIDIDTSHTTMEMSPRLTMAGKSKQVVKATAIPTGRMTQGKTKLKLLQCCINVNSKSAMDKVFDESDEIEDEADDDAPIKFRRFTGPPGQTSTKS